MSTGITVAIRVRPHIRQEQERGFANTRLKVSSNENTITVKSEANRTKKSFNFDHVFDHNTDQITLFDKCQVSQLIHRVFQGYNSTIFAYGQTGSGKTYTMEGDFSIKRGSEREGFIPRTIKYMFQEMKRFPQKNFSVYVSFLQIYNEKIFDMLNSSELKPNFPGLKVRWNKKDQFHVENLTVYQCMSAENLLQHYVSACKNRIMASHALNISSSRSHTMLSLTIESIDTMEGSMFSSRLQLVDLAGSEKVHLTGNHGRALKESIDINRSLFTLRQVISRLAFGQGEQNESKHTPFRDSKLTCLMKQSLTGNSHVLMIACLAPCDEYFEENMSTLTYASKAAVITSQPKVNTDQKFKVLSELRVQVNSQSQELERAYKCIELLIDLKEVIGLSEQEISAKLAVLEQLYQPDVIKRAENKLLRRDRSKNNVIAVVNKKGYRSVSPINRSTKQAMKAYSPISFKKDRSTRSKSPEQQLQPIEELSQQKLNELLLSAIWIIKELLSTNKKNRSELINLRTDTQNLTAQNSDLKFEIQNTINDLEDYKSLMQNRIPTQDILKYLQNDALAVQNREEISKSVLKLQEENKELYARIAQLETERHTYSQVWNTEGLRAVTPPKAMPQPQYALPEQGSYGMRAVTPPKAMQQPQYSQQHQANYHDESQAPVSFAQEAPYSTPAQEPAKDQRYAEFSPHPSSHQAPVPYAAPQPQQTAPTTQTARPPPAPYGKDPKMVPKPPSVASRSSVSPSMRSSIKSAKSPPNELSMYSSPGEPPMNDVRSERLTDFYESDEEPIEFIPVPDITNLLLNRTKAK